MWPSLLEHDAVPERSPWAAVRGLPPVYFFRFRYSAIIFAVTSFS